MPPKGSAARIGRLPVYREAKLFPFQLNHIDRVGVHPVNSGPLFQFDQFLAFLRGELANTRHKTITTFRLFHAGPIRT